MSSYLLDTTLGLGWENKAVADPGLGNEVRGVGGIDFNLLAKLIEKTRRYSTWSPKSGPQTACKSLAWGIVTLALASR